MPIQHRRLIRTFVQRVGFGLVVGAWLLGSPGGRDHVALADEPRVGLDVEAFAFGTASPHNPLRLVNADAANPLRATSTSTLPPSVPTAFLGGTASPQTLDVLHNPLLRRDLQIESAASCAAASCHGGPRPGIARPDVQRGNEYQLWFENDPHSKSWRTICSDESVAMMNRLKILEGTTIIDRAGFDNCLACHNTTLRYDDPRTVSTRPTYTNREGVGCAGCHGPSELWSGMHFQAGWSPESATHLGFVDAGDLYTRARMCASCHIGDKDRDMNHDIIAAGHPALRYELATFHSWQPKHWRDPEANDKTAYEARLWLAGQIAATDATLSLIQTRASQGHTISQWPELAAYDCAACHHELGFKNDRRPLTASRQAVAPLSRWNDSGLRWLIDYRQRTGAATPEDALLIDALDQVRYVMESGAAPDAKTAAEAAQLARQCLAHWFFGRAGLEERNHLRSDRLGRIAALAAGQTETWQTWEAAAQYYLAVVAARESWPGGWNGPLYSTAEALRRGLRYPEMRNVAQFATGEANRPTAHRAEAMRLGLDLAGWLGPVVLDADVMESNATYEFSEADRQSLEAGLREIRERWKSRPKTEPQTEPEILPTPRPKPPAAPAPRRSLDELRKSLEALQSGALDDN